MQKRTKILRIFTLFAVFTAGFLTHAFFFPDILPQEMAQTSKKIVGIAPDSKKDTDPFVRKIMYNEGKFSPDTVVIRFGNYLSITNESSDELMWLESDNKYLSTVRGYGQGEEQKVRMDTEGTFAVTNKLIPHATLKVIVKK